MATTEPKQTRPHVPAEETLQHTKGDFQRLLAHAKENPIQYAAGVVFVLFCILAGLFYRIEQQDNAREVMTEYAEALEEENPALRAANLEAVAEKGSKWSAEALYLAAESAIRAEEYEKAESTFKRLQEDYPDSDYAKQALDGLGFIAENRGDYDAALASYRKLYDEYPDTFLARRQPLNIGRVLEAKEDFAGASESYEEQMSSFPDSTAAIRAEMALEKLKEAHPGLFPEEPEAETDETAEADSAEEEATVAAEPPAEEAPAEEAPAAEEPAPEAPVAE